MNAHTIVPPSEIASRDYNLPYNETHTQDAVT